MSKKLILLSLWLFIGAGVVDVEAQTAEFLGLSGITIYPVLPHPTDLSTLYVGTQNNGLYKTSDQGSNWQSMNNGMSDNSVWNVRFDPNNTNRMYAATGVIGSQGSSSM